MIRTVPIAYPKDTRMDRVKNYVEVGYLLHIIGLASAASSYALLTFTLNTIAVSNLVSYLFFLWLSSFFFMNALLSQLDAYSRYQNFKQVRDQLYENGFQPRIAKPLAKSSCQRFAAMAAGKRLSLKEPIDTFYRDMGYRWYHILPDFIWSKPMFLFHPWFWKSTFFVKHYKSRYF